MSATPDTIPHEPKRHHGGSDRDEPTFPEILRYVADQLPADVVMSRTVTTLDLPIIGFDGKVKFLVSIVRRG